MREEAGFFQSVHGFAERLKGGPLRQSEKDAIVEAIEKGEGTAFERASRAVEDVLHANPSVISEKVGASDTLQEMQEAMRKKGYEWEGLVEP